MRTRNAHLHAEQWQLALPKLRERAIGARLEGVSHKNFKVGAAALLFFPVGRHYLITDGANYKPKKGSGGPRVCAEETAMALAELRGFYIVGMVIAGDYQPDDHSGLCFESLVPCFTCRARLQVLKDQLQLAGADTRFESLRVEGGDDINATTSFTLEWLLNVAPPPTDLLEAEPQSVRLRYG